MVHIQVILSRMRKPEMPSWKQAVKNPYVTPNFGIEKPPVLGRIVTGFRIPR